jgi:hypothetical protein
MKKRLFIVVCFIAFGACVAQPVENSFTRLTAKINGWRIGLDAGVAHMDVFSANSLPTNIAQSTSFYAGVNQIAFGCNLSISEHIDPQFSLFLLEYFFGYRFNVGQKFWITPKFGFSAGGGNLENVEYTTSSGYLVTIDFSQVVFAKGNNAIFVGLSPTYRYLKFSPSTMFASNHMFGLSLKVGYEFSKQVIRN